MTAPNSASHRTDRSPWRAPLARIYGDDVDALDDAVAEVVAQHAEPSASAPLWTERDAWLITYPDQFQRQGEPALTTLRWFLDHALGDAFSGIHILPFFPSSSDEGFAIKDYSSVDPTFGSWDDIASLAATRRVMVDAVINHLSVDGEWFAAWRSGQPEYTGFFRTESADADLTTVVRAREHPLLTPVGTTRGERLVWTTFSADQADLDYRTPQVLLRVLEVVLDYAKRGAAAIRLDAVGFLWKEQGTSSIHLPQTHAIVQFLRACLSHAYPGVMLITETNVPHEENISYLGTPTVAEAHAVYQFPLPPLVLHAFAAGDATRLRSWLSDVAPSRPDTTFLNFLASHDGVGLRPLEGLVEPEAIDELVRHTEANGGLVSWRADAGGAPTPYELNATWLDLIGGPTSGTDALARHLGSHAIMCAVQGMPAVYVQSLLGSRNDLRAVEATGAPRSINRTRFDDVGRLSAEMGAEGSDRHASVAGLRDMLAVRSSHPAFHPNAEQRLLDTPPGILSVERTDPTAGAVQVHVNLSERPHVVASDAAALGGHRFDQEGRRVELGPWGHVWAGAS